MLGRAARGGAALLVVDLGSIGRLPPSPCAVFPADLPVDLVGAEEGQVHTGIPGGCNRIAPSLRPVLVVSDRHVNLMVPDQPGVALYVDGRHVADIVAIALEPADHRVLGVEQIVFQLRSAGREGAVIAELLRHRRAGAAVGVVAAIWIVGLPGGVGGLEQQVRVAGIIPHDERDMACPAVVGARWSSDVNARCCVSRNLSNWRIPTSCRSRAVDRWWYCRRRSGWLRGCNRLLGPGNICRSDEPAAHHYHRSSPSDKS